MKVKLVKVHDYIIFYILTCTYEEGTQSERDEFHFGREGLQSVKAMAYHPFILNCILTGFRSPSQNITGGFLPCNKRSGHNFLCITADAKKKGHIEVSALLSMYDVM